MSRREARLANSAIALVALYHAVSSAAAQETGPLSLEAATEIALRENPTLRVARSGVDAAGAQLSEARRSRLPLVQARETWTHSNNPVFVFGSLLEQGRFGPENFDPEFLNDPDAIDNFRTELSLRLPLFDQLLSSSRIGQAKSGHAQAMQRVGLAEQQTRLEVIRTYFGVLVAEAQEQVAAEAVRTAEADAERTRNMVQTGLRVESDLLSAEVQLAQLQQQRIQAAGLVATSYATLNVVLGLDAVTPQRLEGVLPETSFEIPATEELIRLALENRTDYAAAREAQNAAHHAARGATGQRLPRIDMFGTYGWSSEDLGDFSSDYAAGASLTLNLLDPGRGARVDLAHAQEVVTAAQALGLARQIQLDVVRAEQQFLSARDRLSLSARAMSQATDAFRIVQDRYQEGLTTITEVLRAQTALLDARRGALQARYDHHVGYAGLLLATGRLTGVEAFLEPTGEKK